jgi:transposase
LLKKRVSVREIANLVSISKSAVGRIRQKLEDTGDYRAAPRSGRPRKVSARDERAIARIVFSGRADNAVEAAQEFNDASDSPVSANTVRRSLRRQGFEARVKKHKPLLSKRHVQRRLAFAQKYRDWTADDWRRVVFSDESRFFVRGSPGREYVWVRPGVDTFERLVQPTVKHGGGSVFVWGCMTSKGIGWLCSINEKLNKEIYCDEILSGYVKKTLRYYGLRKKDVVFQHDNDTKHTAKLTSTWLKNNQFEVLEWPAQSPDLNPIE